MYSVAREAGKSVMIHSCGDVDEHRLAVEHGFAVAGRRPEVAE